jgi:hypothetical protein
MPRNSSGVYTLPAGNPVVADTIIDVDWANPTMADIGNELTLSLPRNGSAGMLGPLMLIQSAIAPLEAVPLQQLQEYLPLSGGTLTGDLVFNGTGLRIKGDFTNSLSQRMAVQTSVLNGNTQFTLLPNGTSQNSTFSLSNSSNLTAYQVGQMTMNQNALTFNSNAVGLPYLPIVFNVGGGERMQIDSVTSSFYFYGRANESPVFRMIPNGTGQGAVIQQYYGADIANTHFGGFRIRVNDFNIYSNYTGASSAKDMTFDTNGVGRLRIGADGVLRFGQPVASVDAGYIFMNPVALNWAAVLQTEGQVGDKSYPGLQIQKGDADVDATQIFIRFISGVATSAAGMGQIQGAGAGQAAFGVYSDRSLKDNIVDLPSQLGKVCSLRPVEFDYKAGGHQTGFIAQEVLEQYPDFVGEDKDGLLVLSGLGRTEAILIKAIQELKAEIDDLRSKLR